MTQPLRPDPADFLGRLGRHWGWAMAALSHSEVPHRAWLIFMGILSIIAGLILLAYPGISLLVLYVIVGIWLLVFGFMEISIAWQMRSVSHRTSGREAHAT